MNNLYARVPTGDNQISCSDTPAASSVNSENHTVKKSLPSFNELVQSIQFTLNQNVPRDQVQSRQGAKGMTYHYLSTDYVIRRMNEIFGFYGWSHEIMESRFYESENSTLPPTMGAQQENRKRYEAYARVRVTIRVPTWIYNDTTVAHEICHEDFGYTRGSFSPDTAIKGACSDALKRTCRHFGESLGNSLA